MRIQISIMFSQTAEYALRAAVSLAQSFPHSRTTHDIATATHVPAGYLSKVLQTLGRAGLVHAARGKHGGWELARSPHDITILEIVNVVDPIRRIHSCPLQLQAHRDSLCPLHQRMDDAMATIENTLASSRLEELLAGPVQPLCEALCTV